MRFKKNPEADIIDAIQIPVNIGITFDGKCHNVCPGDWIAVDGIGVIRVYTDEILKKAFVSCD